MQVQDAINLALMAIGHLQRAGVSANSSELARGLVLFNNIVDTSNTSRSLIFTECQNVFNCANQQQTYSWGTGGTWNAPRPQRVTQANLLLPTSPVIRRPMAIWERREWGSIALQQIYTYPEGLYCDYANVAKDGTQGAVTIYLEPIPDSNYQVETYSWQANAQAASIATAILFPPGYQEWFICSLAIRLAPMHDLLVPQSVLDTFRRAEQGIERMATAEACPLLDTDAALQSGHGLYNWMTGLPDA
jgi:hypothetical protein